MSLKDSIKTAVKVKTTFDSVEQYQIASCDTLLDSIILCRQMRTAHGMPKQSLEHDKEYCIALRSARFAKMLGLNKK